MSYTPFQDGTQAFAIPASPVTINSVAYIAEDININNGTDIKTIKDANGILSGRAILQGDIVGTCTLQLATNATALPPKGTIFTLFGISFYVTDIGTAYKQGDYTKVNMGFVYKIN